MEDCLWGNFVAQHTNAAVGKCRQVEENEMIARWKIVLMLVLVGRIWIGYWLWRAGRDEDVCESILFWAIRSLLLIQKRVLYIAGSLSIQQIHILLAQPCEGVSCVRLSEPNLRDTTVEH